MMPNQFTEELTILDEALSRDDVTFHGPLLKVQRATLHKDDLIKRLDRFKNENVRRIVRASKGKSAGPLKRVTRSFEEDTPVVLGDIFHNLRSALDHAFAIAVRLNGNEVTRRTRFPFEQTEANFIARMENATKNGNAPSSAVYEALRNEIQPYEGGKLGIYGLNELNNSDKHSLLTPTVGEFKISGMTVFDKQGKKTGEWIGGPKIIFNPRSDISIFGSEPDKDLFGFAEPTRFKLNEDPNKAFKVLFEIGQPYEGLEVRSVVSDLVKVCALTLGQIQDAMVNDLVLAGKVKNLIRTVNEKTGEERLIRSANTRRDMFTQNIWSRFLK